MFKRHFLKGAAGGIFLAAALMASSVPAIGAFFGPAEPGGGPFDPGLWFQNGQAYQTTNASATLGTPDTRLEAVYAYVGDFLNIDVDGVIDGDLDVSGNSTLRPLVKIVGPASPDSSNYFQIQNAGDTARYFAVSATGTTLAVNNSVNLETNRTTSNLKCLLCLKYDDGQGENNSAKAMIGFVDHNGVEQVWLQAHKCLTTPCTGGNLHQHFSVEASDAAGLKQTRLGVGYGADVVDVTVNQANLVVNRNAGMTNGNISMSGAGLGGNFLHASDFSFYPQSGTNSTVAFRVAESSGNLRLFGIGTSTVFMDDTLDVTGSLYASGNLGVGTTAPANDLVVSRSGSSGTVNGPELVLRQNQTNINATTNSNVGEIYFAGDDVAPAESGFGAKIRGQASAAWNGTANDYPTDLLFFTQADGGATGMLERLRLTSSGDAYVGTPSGDARLTVAASSESPTTNLFTVRNSTDSARYLTVSSTATIASVPFLAADGSAGAPGFAFAQDTNTGIYRVGPDSLGLSAGGLRFQITSAGAGFIAGTSSAPGLFVSTDTNTGFYSAAADILGISANGITQMTVSATSTSIMNKLAMPATLTPDGTTGNQTINKPAGTVNVAAAASSVTVTNSLVTSTTIVDAMAQTNDANCYVKDTEPANGSVVIRMTGPCAGETKVAFWLIAPNP